VQWHKANTTINQKRNKMKKRLFKFLNNTNETLDFSDVLTLIAFALAISVGLMLLLIIEQTISNL